MINVHCPGSLACRSPASRLLARECLDRFALTTKSGSLTLERAVADYFVSDHHGVALSHATSLFATCWQADVAELLGPETSTWPKLVKITWERQLKK